MNEERTVSVYDKWNIFVTLIFHNGQPSLGGNRKTFKVMTLTNVNPWFSSPIELEIKETTDICDSYFDLHLTIGSEGRLITKHYDKRDDFNFTIVKFPFKCNKIPAAPAYGTYICSLLYFKLNGKLFGERTSSI
jgi:hypothetical protein